MEHPEHHVLQRVHVIDEARHEVTSAEGGEARGSNRLEPLEHADAQVGEHAQRGIVADQSLAVAEKAS